MFTHDANDHITIGAFTATLDDFLLLEPSYRLPDGALWQFYVPGVKHLIGYGLYQRDGGPSWADGDVFLANESSYAAVQPDTSPNVLGFEAALIAAFGGDYLAINSLYSGWPLFKDALESAQWTLADLLLTNAYVNAEITTAIYSAIIAAAQANYIPMALQGRPGVMPLNVLDEVTSLIVLMDGTHQADAISLAVADAGQVIIPIATSGDTIEIPVLDVAQVDSPILVGADDVPFLDADDPAPALVMS